MIDSIVRFLSSPVLLKLSVTFLLFLYFANIRNKRVIPCSWAFTAICAIIAVRDLLFFFMPEAALYLISDILILNAYIRWVNEYRKERRFDPIVLGLSGAYIVLALVSLFVPDVSWLALVLHLLLFGFIIYLSVVMYSISTYNTENAEIVMTVRQWVAGIPAVFNILTIVVGYDTLFVNAILIPLSYAVHFIVLYQYQQQHDYETNTQLTYLSDYLDSLFEFMRNIGNAIAERIEMSKVLDYIVASAVKNSNGEAGAILLIDEFEDILAVKAVYGFFPPPYPVPKLVKTKLSGVQDYFQSTKLRLGQSILGEAALTGEPIFIRNTSMDERTKQNTEEDTCFVSSIIVIPLVVSKKILGVLSVLKRQKNQYFDDADFDHVKTFADYASLTMDNLFTYMQLLEKQEIEREVGIAAEIQEKLLPHRIPELPSAKIAAFSVPAKGVSGDYYDIIPIRREGKVSLVICDVAGKGVPASLVMVMIRTIIHLIAGAQKDASKIVTWINRGIAGKIDIERFATLSFLTYDMNARTIEYSNAAHHPLMIYRAATGTIESIDTEGLPIGLEPQTKYGLATATLAPGDILVLYTDGVIEAMNARGEQYSYESLARIIKENKDMEPDDLTEIIKTDIENFVGNAKQHDDQTLLLMKIR
jgi:sigma-B regulation protein RsbU (phosphoserine phosphatase)